MESEVAAIERERVWGDIKGGRNKEIRQLLQRQRERGGGVLKKSI